MPSLYEQHINNRLAFRLRQSTLLLAAQSRAKIKIVTQFTIKFER
jgi:hypothetical protein